MNRKEKSKEEKFKELEEIKKVRQFRIKLNLPAIELDSIEKNKKLHNLLFNLMTVNRILNLCSKDFPEKDYIKKLRKNPNIGNRPIIFAPNHVRKQDIEIVMEAVPEHMILLSGDYENVHGDIGGILLEKNGIIYFDMSKVNDSKDLIELRNYLYELNEYIKLENNTYLIDEYNMTKEKYKCILKNKINDRKNVRAIIRDILSNNYNMLWFYEGSWNLSQNKPYYDGSYFIVEAAIDTNAIVLPISYDIIDKKIGKKAVVKFGNPIDYRKIYGNRKLSAEDKKNALDILKGEIGKNIMEIWDEYSNQKRDDISKKYGRVPNTEEDLTHDFNKKAPLEAYYEEYKKRVLGEWHFTEDDIEKKHFVDETITSKEDAFDHLNKLKLNKNNAFLASKRNHF